MTLLDISKGMLQLHKLDLVHSDLKVGVNIDVTYITAAVLVNKHTAVAQAANVLLRSCESDDRGVIAKIADFGLSFKMEGVATHMSFMCCGTLAYMAPEAILEGHKSKASDV